MAIKTICHAVIIYYPEQAHLNMFPESRENLFLLSQQYHNRSGIATAFFMICQPRTVPAYQMKYLLRITMCIPKRSIPRNIIIVNCFSGFYYILYYRVFIISYMYFSAIFRTEKKTQESQVFFIVMVQILIVFSLSP